MFSWRMDVKSTTSVRLVRVPFIFWPRRGALKQPWCCSLTGPTPIWKARTETRRFTWPWRCVSSGVHGHICICFLVFLASKMYACQSSGKTNAMPFISSRWTTWSWSKLWSYLVLTWRSTTTWEKLLAWLLLAPAKVNTSAGKKLLWTAGGEDKSVPR